MAIKVVTTYDAWKCDICEEVFPKGTRCWLIQIRTMVGTLNTRECLECHPE